MKIYAELFDQLAVLLLLVWIAAFIVVYHKFSFGPRKERLLQTLETCPLGLKIIVATSAAWLIIRLFS